MYEDKHSHINISMHSRIFISYDLIEKIIYCTYWYLTFLSFVYFYFSLPMYNRECVIFASSFRSWDIDRFTRFEVLWIRKLLFSSWSVCVLVSYQYNWKTSYRKSKFGIICQFYVGATWNILKIGQILCVQGHTKEFYHIEVNFLLVYFNIFRLY